MAFEGCKDCAALHNTIWSTIDGKGPADLASIPFASTFVRDFSGACFKLPADIGAFAVP